MWNATIPDDELQDFWAGCKSAGYDPQSFQVQAKEEYPPGPPGPIKRLVKVMRQQYVRDFDASSGHDWVTTAINAVRQGFFGKQKPATPP